jgi:cell division control protein 12
MKRLGTHVNLIPVIAKADTLTQSDLFTFKQHVCPYLYLNLLFFQPDVSMSYLYIRDIISTQNIRIYQPPVEADDEASAEHVLIFAQAVLFSIIGSTEDVQPPR